MPKSSKSLIQIAKETKAKHSRTIMHLELDAAKSYFARYGVRRDSVLLKKDMRTYLMAMRSKNSGDLKRGREYRYEQGERFGNIDLSVTMDGRAGMKCNGAEDAQRFVLERLHHIPWITCVKASCVADQHSNALTPDPTDVDMTVSRMKWRNRMGKKEVLSGSEGS